MFTWDSKHRYDTDKKQQLDNIVLSNNFSDYHLINVKDYTGPAIEDLHVQNTDWKCLHLEKNPHALPIFIIEAHGNIKTKFHIDRRSTSLGVPVVNFARNSPFVKSKKNQWLIYTSPVGANADVCEENAELVKKIMKHPKEIKNVIFSNSPEKLLTYSQDKDEDVIYSEKCNGLFCPQHNEYPDKTNYFFDHPNHEPYYEWLMGIIPVFGNNKTIPAELHSLKKYKNKTRRNIERRIINEKILSHHDWKGYSELKERYRRITQLIYKSLPIYDKKSKTFSKGKSIQTHQIMDILGEGIYIFNNCNPITNDRESSSKNNNIIQRVSEKFFKRFNDISYTRWKVCFLDKYLKESREKIGNLKLYIQRDEDASKYGRIITGVDVSRVGRVRCQTKFYTPATSSEYYTDSDTEHVEYDSY